MPKYDFSTKCENRGLSVLVRNWLGLALVIFRVSHCFPRECFVNYALNIIFKSSVRVFKDEEN